MEKIIINGWTGKDCFNKTRIWSNYDEKLQIFKTKGNKLAWGSKEYPPTKVKITIEKI